MVHKTGSRNPRKIRTSSKPRSNPTTPKENAVPQKRNNKSLVIYGLLGLVILALIIALVLFFVLFNKSENVCKTPECINLANQLHNFRDDSVDPCNDFFKYSCGKYIEHVSVEGPRFTKKNEIMNGLIREFILKNATTSSKSEKAMKHLFGKCKEFKQIKDSENASYVRIGLDAMSFGFPMTTLLWLESNFDVNGETVCGVKSGSCIYIADLIAKIASVNSRNRQIIDFGLFSASLGGARNVWIAKNEAPVIEKNEIYQTLNRVFGKFGWLRNQADIDGIHWLSTEMNKLQPSNPQQVTGLSDFSKLKSSLPDINFISIFQKLSGSQRLKDFNRIIRGAPGFDQLGKDIQTFLTNHKRHVANYLIFRYIQSSIDNLPSKKDPCYGVCDCEEYVIKYLPWPSTRVFVRNHFDKETLEDVDELVEDIRSGYIEMFKDSEWLKDSTRKDAILKTEKMKKTIGYAKELETTGALDRIFDANILPDDVMHTILKKAERFTLKTSVQYAFLGKYMHPAFELQSNAFYAPLENSLTVLSPLMDDPFYHTSYPTYAKLAGAGFIIGHEIGHGFDAMGVHCDENGNLRNWWTPSDSMEYDKRGSCLIHQYTHYDHPKFGKNLNGSTTISENIADNLGSKAVWRAFKKLDLSKEKKIVGFEDYSIEKLYFQIEALNWCDSRSPIELDQQKGVSHGTSSFRVNGVLANMKGFSDAFNCPAGSPMNPAKKCELF